MFGFCNQILNMMILTIATTVLLPLEAVGNESLRWLNVGRSCSVGPSSSSFLEIHLNMFAKTLRPSFFLSRHFESNHSRFCEIPPSTSRILMPKTSPNIFDWGRPKHFAYHSGAFRHTKVGLDIVIEVHWKQSQIKGIQSEDIRFGDLESVFFHQELLGMQPNECCEKSHSSRENTVFFSLGILTKEWHTLCALNVFHFISHQAGFGHICYFREDQRSGNKILMMWTWANKLVISLGGVHSKSIPMFDGAWPIFRGC